MDYEWKAASELEEMAQFDSDAACELGVRYLYGEKDCDVNLNRAYQLFHKGEELDHAKSLYMIGEMYARGLLFAQNDDYAQNYKTRAEIKGYRSAGISDDNDTLPVELLRRKDG